MKGCLLQPLALLHPCLLQDELLALMLAGKGTAAGQAGVVCGGVLLEASGHLVKVLVLQGRKEEAERMHRCVLSACRNFLV